MLTKWENIATTSRRRYFNVITDSDGMIRNVPAFFVHNFCKEKGVIQANKEKWLKQNPKKKLIPLLSKKSKSKNKASNP